jgi:hypothetical protein
MRWTRWRRAIAVVALLMGVGVGASTVPASAAPMNAHNGPSVTTLDFWW